MNAEIKIHLEQNEEVRCSRCHNVFTRATELLTLVQTVTFEPWETTVLGNIFCSGCRAIESEFSTTIFAAVP